MLLLLEPVALVRCLCISAGVSSLCMVAGELVGSAIHSLSLLWAVIRLHNRRHMYSAC